MTTKTGIILLGIAFLLAGVTAVWCLMTIWAAPYQELNATWSIHGVCTNVLDGTPVRGAQVIASFRVPIAFKHHWRNPPPLTTKTVVTKTDDHGRFEVTGGGGSVYIKIQAEGYREPEPWENWSYSARNRLTQVNTNIALKLEPILLDHHDQ